MALLTKVGKLAAPLAGAVFIEPLLNWFAPSVKPLIKQFVQSDEAQQFLKDLVEGAAVAGSGVCSNFIASQSEKLLDTLKPAPRLDQALITALRKAFAGMRDDLRIRNQHNILSTFDQFFTDWDEKLQQVQADVFLRKKLLETKQFAHLFYEWPKAELEEQMWWMSIRTELQAWTTYVSIPAELEEYLKDNFLLFASDALTITLDTEEYKESWNEFQKSVGTQILSTLRALETHILELRELAQVAGGQFIQDHQPIEFPLRKPIDLLLEDLSSKEIYLQRETYITEEERVKINGLGDLTTRDGYFLLSSPAGSGKSTLMARWIREFTSSFRIPSSQTAVNVCYYFYSKQEGTSNHNKGLTILSDQLLKAHYIQANVNSLNPATIDSIIPNLLEVDHPGRLFVIVDGLDEAGEPSTATDFLSLFKRVFPHKLGKNTTVILTVRNNEGANSLQHYRNEFGLPLNALEIQEVSASSLASYLSTSGDDKLKAKAQDEGFLKQIITKTEGLAIYVHYLLDELSQADEAQWTEIVVALPKGFEKYVSTSLPAALAGKSQWEDALSFIALTQSPLAMRDLISLTDFSGNKLKKADFDRVSWNIKRWLRSENDIWAFSHQKIGEVFYELYVVNERALYIAHLLAYCAMWKQNESRYVLQHYAELLQREQKEDQLYDLACNKEFLDLQRTKLTDNPNAQLRTLQLAMLYAADKDKATITSKFLLEHAAMVEEMSANLWSEANKNHPYSVLLQIADNFTDHNRRFAWYLLTAWKLATSHKVKELESVLKKLNSTTFPLLSTRLFNLALSVLPILLQTSEAKLIKSIYTKALHAEMVEKGFVGAAEFLSTIGDFDKALETAHTIEDSGKRSQALGSIAIAVANAGYSDRAEKIFDEAEQLAHAIKDTMLRDRVLERLATAFAQTQNVDKALQIAHIIKDKRPQALGHIAVALANAQYFDKAEEVFAEAQQLAHEIKDTTLRFRVLAKLVTDLAQTQNFDRALQTAHIIEDSGKRPQALGQIAVALANAQYFDRAEEVFAEAQQLAHAIKDTALRFRVLAKLVTDLAQTQNFDKAVQTAHTIEDSGKRSQALGSIAVALANAQFNVEALSTAQSIEDAVLRSEILRRLKSLETQRDTPAVNQASEEIRELFDETMYIAQTVAHSVSRRQALRKLCEALAHPQTLNQALVIAHIIEDPSVRSQALSNIAVAVANAGYSDRAETVFDEAEQLAHAIKDTLLRDRVLERLATAFAQTQDFDKALQTAHTIKDSVQRSQALGHIAVALANAQHFDKAKKVFDEAKFIALSVRDYLSRSDAIRRIAKYLTVRQILDEIEKTGSTRELRLLAPIWRNLSTALAHAQGFDKAVETAHNIEDPKQRSQALANIARCLANAQYFEWAEEVFDQAEQTASSLRDFSARSQALRHIAVALAKAGEFTDVLRIIKTLRPDDLVIILDELAKAKRPEGLKKHLVALSYDSDSALRACAQMIVLYESQAEEMYGEICRHIDITQPLCA